MELIIQGVFRSGTTILFKCLRKDPESRSYYEPLHPELLEMVEAAREGKKHPRKNELFQEYVPLLDELSERFDPSFGYDHAISREDHERPELEAYLRTLEGSAPRTSLQFNRAFWMVPWLARTFPEATLLHVVRDPRSVLYSQMRRRPEHRSVVLENGDEAADPSAIFSQRAEFSYYYTDTYLDIAREAQLIEDVEDAPPYVRWLNLWGSQVEACHREGEKLLGDQYVCTSYEAFARGPVDTLASLYEALGRRCPPEVCRFADREVHPPKERPWEEDRALAQRFQEGFDEAGIEPIATELGYAP